MSLTTANCVIRWWLAFPFSSSPLTPDKMFIAWTLTKKCYQIKPICFQSLTIQNLHSWPLALQLICSNQPLQMGHPICKLPDGTCPSVEENFNLACINNQGIVFESTKPKPLTSKGLMLIQLYFQISIYFLWVWTCSQLKVLLTINLVSKFSKLLFNNSLVF